VVNQDFSLYHLTKVDKRRKKKKKNGFGGLFSRWQESKVVTKIGGCDWKKEK